MVDRLALGSVWVLLLVSACGDADGPGPDLEPAWQAVFSETPGGLLRAWGSSSKDVYVVGADATGEGPIARHFDGRRWRALKPTVTGDLWWVQGVGPDDVRMVGDGGMVLRYTPSNDSFEIRPTPTSMRLFGVWGASSTDVWYVGGDIGRNRGIILRDNGSEVTEMALTQTASATFFKAHGFGANDVWFVGQGGKTVRWNGQTFSEAQTSTGLPLMGIHGQVPDRLFASGGVANGVILTWNGNTWTDETPANVPQMIGVWALDEDRAYAVGFNGRIFRRAAGAWAELTETIPTFQDLHAIWVDDEDNIWATGGRLAADPPIAGVLIRYGPPISSEVIE